MAIFLTGSTGYLGSYLVAGLWSGHPDRLNLLVRAKTEQEARERLWQSLQLHLEFPDFLEEDWLYEAITETYVPILDMMERLAGEKVHYRLTMSLTPPLCNMLSDDLLMSRYRKKLEKLSNEVGKG